LLTTAFCLAAALFLLAVITGPPSPRADDEFQNVPRIRAATDVVNTPMAAFALAGDVAFERQVDMTWR
jgi:hypothetical protein